jgi:hypothetical protein
MSCVRVRWRRRSRLDPAALAFRAKGSYQHLVVRPTKRGIMNVVNFITPALSAVLGLAVGAVLQYYFSRRLEATRHFQELRTRAYADFIGGVAETANASRKGDQALQLDALAKTTEAKIRILLYGSRAVVNTVAEFSIAQGSVSSEAVAPRFVELIQAMRADSAIRLDGIADTSILGTAFGPRENWFS